MDTSQVPVAQALGVVGMAFVVGLAYGWITAWLRCSGPANRGKHR